MILAAAPANDRFDTLKEIFDTQTGRGPDTQTGGEPDTQAEKLDTQTGRRHPGKRDLTQGRGDLTPRKGENL